jgi:hypothetical protein
MGRFVNKRAIYQLGIASLAHALLHVTDFPVVNVHVDELSSVRIWQHTLLCLRESKSANTVVYFDWMTVIYIYVYGICRTQCMLPNSNRR